MSRDPKPGAGGLPNSRLAPRNPVGIPQSATEMIARTGGAEVRFFQRIPEADRELMSEMGRRLDFKFGQSIVREGDPSDGLYVMMSGQARVVRKEGNAVETVLGSLGAGDLFGEIASMGNGDKRTATVRASGSVTVLRIASDDLVRLLEARPHLRGWFSSYAKTRAIATLIRDKSPFSNLPDQYVNTLAEAVVSTNVARDQIVFREGDESGALFLIRSGRIRITKETPEGPLAIAYLGEGQLFGVTSCMQLAPRKATATAMTESVLLAVAYKPFEALYHASAEFRQTIDVHAHSIDFNTEASIPLDIAELERSGSVPSAPEARDAREQGPKKPMPGSVLAPTDDAPFASADGYFVKKKSRVRSFPHVQQVDATDCGAACIAMLARYHGKRISIGRIRALAGVSVDGCSLQDMVNAAGELGLAARTARVSARNVDRVPLPAVIHWTNSHWVVLVEVRKDKALISDPASALRWVSRAELAEKWNGYAALFDFTEAFRNVSEDKADLRWLFAYFKPHSGVIANAVLLAFVGAALTLLLPVLAQVVVDRIVVDGVQDMLMTIVVIMGVTFFLMVLSRLIQGYLLAFVAVRVDASMLDYITRRLLALPLKYYTTRRTGDVQRRIEGARYLRDMIVSSGVSGVLALVQGLVALLLMMMYSPVLAGVYLSMTPLYLGLMFFSARILRPMYAVIEEEFGKYQSDQIDAIKGIEAVKAASAEATFRDGLLDRFLGMANKQFTVDQAALTYEGLLQGVGYLSSVLFLWVGATLAIKGEMTLGAFVAFNSLVGLANTPIFTVLGLWEKYQRGLVFVNRLSDVFEQVPEQGRDRSNLIPVTTLSGAVELRGVGFRYGGVESTPILRNIDLKVARGETIALVGRSGSGKTTLVKLLSGLLEPTDGSILFDGVDQRVLNLRDLRRRIGFVLQENHIFSASILDNIAFGEEPELERAVTAARAADAHGFISSLPLGYATRIGETGVRLSGGQTQRIAIARALYKKPALFIFDEATSALDSESEASIQDNLSSYFAGRTAFVIAHRLSTIRDADRIVVLEKGEIVEQGTHVELMSRRGLYYDLVNKQIEE